MPPAVEILLDDDDDDAAALVTRPVRCITSIVIPFVPDGGRADFLSKIEAERIV